MGENLLEEGTEHPRQERIDASDLARSIANIDILSVVERYTQVRWKASTQGGEYAGPCPLCGGTDRFIVWPHHPSGRGRFWCRNSSCPAHKGGDVVDFVRLVASLDFLRALEFLGIAPFSHDVIPHYHVHRRILRRMMPHSSPLQQRSEGGRARGKEERPPRPVDLAFFAREAQYHLWHREGAQAVEWLCRRGLTKDTLREWGVGYNPTSRHQSDVWLPQGIFIPYLDEERVVAIKVRRLPYKKGSPKYIWIKGSRAGFFGLHHLKGRRVLVLVESELDAILIWQEARDLVDAVATSSASYRPTPEVLLLLARSPYWLLIRDRDQAGKEQAAWWTSFSARVTTVTLPQGKDPTEYVQRGGNLREWLIQEGMGRGWL